MLIATLITLLLFAGGGERYLHILGKYVSDFVEDDARAEQAEAVVERMKAEREAFVRRIFDRRGALIDLNLRHDSTRREYRQLFLDLDRRWEEYERATLDLRFELRESIERDEWNALFAKIEQTMGRR